jgi:hypothetical protein
MAISTLMKRASARSVVGAILLSGLSLLMPLAGHAASTQLWVSDSSGNLGRVNTLTGNATVVGNMGVTMTDIAFDSGGNLYGISFSDLYSINSETAAASLIGSLGLDDANSLTFSADDTLYLARDEFNSDLRTVDILTGTTTAIGLTGQDSAGDLAFNDGGLYMSTSDSNLAEIDVGTGAGTVIGGFGVNDVFGLATMGDGQLYGVADTSIYWINTGNGAATFLTEFGGQGLGNTYGAAYNKIPVPAAVWLFGSALAGLGWMRRKQTV